MKPKITDIHYYTYIKNVAKCGISRLEAREIVDTALAAGNGKDVDMYISYAITLKYGLKISQKKITL